jgi:ABC-type nitrate/sulfonate/bicarbonate transport system permease component
LAGHERSVLAPPAPSDDLGRLGPRLALRPIVSFLFPAPKIALYPAMLIVFGLGTASRVAFGFTETVFPIVVARAAGTSQVEPRLLWSAAALGTSRRAARTGWGT